MRICKINFFAYWTVKSANDS